MCRRWSVGPVFGGNIARHHRVGGELDVPFRTRAAAELNSHKKSAFRLAIADADHSIRTVQTASTLSGNKLALRLHWTGLAFHACELMWPAFSVVTALRHDDSGNGVLENELFLII